MKDQYNEKELEVMKWIVCHAIYDCSILRTKLSEIVDDLDMSNYMVSKIMKRLESDSIILGKKIRYEPFTVWRKTRYKPKDTEYCLWRDKLYSILGLDAYFDAQHVRYKNEDFSGFPIDHKVIKSNTTESVYVEYWNTNTLESTKVRFSYHSCKDYLIGEFAKDREDILRRLGLLSA